MLMLLHSLGGAWRTSAESILKKKFACGILTSDLFKRILTGHQVTECKQKHLASPHCMEQYSCPHGVRRSTRFVPCRGLTVDNLQVRAQCAWAERLFPAAQEELRDFFPTLLDFAGTLTSAAPEASRKAGAALYVSLFLEFQSSFHRQVEHSTGPPPPGLFAMHFR